jgi:glycosyltransferase involved in cell wall biosynthesis
VTVVIPTRNRRDLLARTLWTVLHQSHGHLAVIVVDEASSDDTHEWLGQVTDPRVRSVRHDEPRGVAGARNHGIELAQGQYVAFVDDDDLFAPTKIARQLCSIAERPGARWSFVGAMNIRPDRSLLQDHAVVDVDATQDQLANAVLEMNVIPGGASGVIAETALVRELSGFDGRFKHFADWDMWIRLALAAPAAPVDRPLLGYVVHAGASVNLGGKQDDLDLMLVTYAVERARRLVPSPAPHVLRWIGDTTLRGGDKASAFDAFSRSFRLQPSLMRAVRMTSMWVPGANRLMDLRRVRAIPSGRADEATAWLSDVPTDAAALLITPTADQARRAA